MKRTLGFALLVCLLLTCWTAFADGAEIGYGFALNTFQAERTAPLPEEKELHLTMLRGEWEAFQLLLLPETDITVTLEAAAFKGTMVDGDRFAVKMYLVNYASADGVERPVSVTQIKKTNPVKLEADKTQAFLLEAHPLSSSAAGDYATTLYVKDASGRVLLEIPLTATVYNYEMPENAWTEASAVKNKDNYFDFTGDEANSFLGWRGYSYDYFRLMQQRYGKEWVEKQFPGVTTDPWAFAQDEAKLVEARSRMVKVLGLEAAVSQAKGKFGAQWLEERYPGITTNLGSAITDAAFVDEAVTTLTNAINYIGFDDAIHVDLPGVHMIAHRGLSGLERENTIAAFLAAGNRSYWGIESDVHRTKDGKYVIIHDDNARRVSGVDMAVGNSNWSDLRTITMTDLEGNARADLKIPTLEEYIRVCKKYDKQAVLELKVSFTPEEISEIIAIIDGCGWLERTTFISFYEENCVAVRQQLPDSVIFFLTTSYAEEQLAFLETWHIGLGVQGISNANITMLKERGILLNIWTVDNATRARELANLGVDYITTNILE